MSCTPTPARTPLGLAARDESTGLAQIGRSRLDLRGIRFTDPGTTTPPGNNPPPATTPPAADTPPVTTPPATTKPPSTAPPSTTTPPAADTPPADPITAPVGGVAFADLPAETQAEVRRLRTADQANRQLKADWEKAGITPELRETLGKQLGFIDETPDAATLTSRVTEVTTRAEQAEAGLQAERRANMVLLAAPDAGARAASLLDSKGFTESIAGLDPADATGIRTAIDTWLTSHPEHRTTTVPPTSVSRPAGQTQGPRKSGLEAAIAKAQEGQVPAR